MGSFRLVIFTLSMNATLNKLFHSLLPKTVWKTLAVKRLKLVTEVRGSDVKPSVWCQVPRLYSRSDEQNNCIKAWLGAEEKLSQDSFWGVFWELEVWHKDLICNLEIYVSRQFYQIMKSSLANRLVSNIG